MDNLLPDLMENGTRYQHYTELIDIFSLGIEVINNLGTHKSDADEKSRVELEHAVNRIQKRMDVLSKYSAKQYALAKDVNSIPKPPAQKLLPAGEPNAKSESSTGVN